MRYSRREFAALALAGLTVRQSRAARAAASTRDTGTAGLGQKPASKWAGVQVGMNVPYNFGTGNYTPSDDILSRCVQLGISAVELRSQPVEVVLGAPGQGAKPEDLRAWRLSAPVARAGAVRKQYEDAGVAIEIVKYDGILNFVDAELDYAFTLARTLGARAISCELPPTQVDAAKRLGRFGDAHQMMIGYHGHTLMTPAHWEQAFTYAAHNGANLDLGHFLGGNKTSPIPFLAQYHDRITHIHVKDKTLKDVNVPFGQGDTPIKEALRLIRDNRWNIQATIEFEYPVPAGSTRMLELQKCVEYCRQCLIA
jgi:sugar phosphate isomerase/epimerase